MHPQRATNYRLIFTTAVICGSGLLLIETSRTNSVDGQSLLGIFLLIWGVLQFEFRSGFCRIEPRKLKINFMKNAKFLMKQKLFTWIVQKVCEKLDSVDKFLFGAVKSIPVFWVTPDLTNLSCPTSTADYFRPPRFSLAIREA